MRTAVRAKTPTMPVGASQLPHPLSGGSAPRRKNLRGIGEDLRGVSGLVTMDGLAPGSRFAWFGGFPLSNHFNSEAANG